MYSHNGHGIVARLCKTYNGGNATNFISTGPVLLRPRYPVPFSGPVRPMRTSPDDGTRRNDSPGTGCNNSVVDPALCLHYWHAVKAGRPWLTGGLSWPVMESTRARARGTRAPRSAPGMAQPQTPSGCGSRQDRPVACLSSCDEALLPATRWRCPEERPTPATPCRWFRRKLCGELFVFCLNKIPLETTLFRLW